MYNSNADVTTKNTSGKPTRGGCITEQFLCNGYSHCPNDHDESLCYNVHTWVFSVIGY